MKVLVKECQACSPPWSLVTAISNPTTEDDDVHERKHLFWIKKKSVHLTPKCKLPPNDSDLQCLEAEIIIFLKLWWFLPKGVSEFHQQLRIWGQNKNKNKNATKSSYSIHF